MLEHWMSRQAGLAILALAWLWIGSLAAAAQPADYPPDDPGDVQSSFSELDRYGHWIEHPEWGTVWVPDVDDDWRPYTVGRWVYTDENGWYWDSEEPFGWAVYHYCRWLDDPSEGWIWVPGTEWGPAWVAWRYGEDAVGWAPLPPDAIWQPDRGLYLTDEFYHGAHYAPFWIFVAPRYLLSSGLHRYVAPPGRNAAYFAHTRPSTHYGFEGRRVFNHGIHRGEVEPNVYMRVTPPATSGNESVSVASRDADPTEEDLIGAASRSTVPSGSIVPTPQDVTGYRDKDDSAVAINIPSQPAGAERIFNRQVAWRSRCVKMLNSAVNLLDPQRLRAFSAVGSSPSVRDTLEITYDLLDEHGMLNAFALNVGQLLFLCADADPDLPFPPPHVCVRDSTKRDHQRFDLWSLQCGEPSFPHFRNAA